MPLVNIKNSKAVNPMINGVLQYGPILREGLPC